MQRISIINSILFCLCLLSAVAPPHLKGQEYEIIETIYLEKDQGLNSRTVNHTFRDSNGYFYFISRNNIQRYDGSDFEDVDLAQLTHINEKLTNLKVISVHPDMTQLIFSSGQELSIGSGQLSLSQVKQENLLKPKITRVDNPNFEYIPLTISREGVDYKWTPEKVFKIDASGSKEIAKIPMLGRPKFLRIDKAGNIIAAYSNRLNHVDNYYVIGKQDTLVDLSIMANVYPTAKDLYTENAFYKWMICGFNGVKIVTLKRDGVEFIRHEPTITKGQFGDLITGITFKNDMLFFTTESGDFSSYDQYSRTWLQEPQAFSFPSTTVYKMLYDSISENLVLIGPDNSITDFYFLDTEKGTLDLHQVPGYHRDFIIKDDGTLICPGGNDVSKGIIRSYNPRTKKSTILKSGFPGIRCIHYSKENDQYYLGTEEGLYVCDSAFNIITSYTRQSPKERFLDVEDIILIQPYEDYLIAGSYGGGAYVIDDKNNKVIKHLSVKFGLTDPNVVSGIVDDDGRCWLGTYNGLNVIDKDFNLIKKVYAYDGLPDREFNSFSAAKNRGKLYFGTINGAVEIDPEKVMKWDSGRRLVVEKLKLYNNQSTSEFPINGDKIDLTKCDSISILYKVTDYYTYPYDNTIPLVTADNNLTDIKHSKEEITISNLSKDATKLSLSIDQSSNQQELVLEFIPDYTKWYKIIAYIISIFLISALIIYLVTTAIRNREKEKTAQNKKISELQLSALQGQMNPHFIFNALGAIQYFIQTSDVDRADEYLSDFALLMRGILDSSSKKFITLKEELQLLKLYTRLEKARFENKFDVNLWIADSVDEETLIPPMIIQPYIENAVNHGLHHLKDKKGQLNLDIDTYGEFIRVIVTDNGIGRKAAQLLRSNIKHKSRAMGITAERIHTINASSDIHIAINVEDLYADNGDATGTKVVIKIKD